MKGALLLIYDFSTVLLPFAALFLARRRRFPHRPDGYRTGLALFALYLAFTLHVTGAGTLFDGLNYGFAPRPYQINLIPFSREMDISYPGNLLLFIPFGWLVPLIWKKWDRLPRVAGAALALSFLIEASQLLNNRFSDVDDLIINTAGALLGYALFCRTSRPKDRPRPEASAWELPLYTAVMLAGHFLLFDELAAASLLYGF